MYSTISNSGIIILIESDDLTDGSSDSDFDEQTAATSSVDSDVVPESSDATEASNSQQTEGVTGGDEGSTPRGPRYMNYISDIQCMPFDVKIIIK